MTVEQLRSVHEANPCRPFTIHLADGQSLPVPHRDFVSMSPGGRTIIVYQPEEALRILDLNLVTQLAVEPAPGNGEAS